MLTDSSWDDTRLAVLANEEKNLNGIPVRQKPRKGDAQAKEEEFREVDISATSEASSKHYLVCTSSMIIVCVFSVQLQVYFHSVKHKLSIHSRND